MLMNWIQFSMWLGSKKATRETIKFLLSFYNLGGKKLIVLKYELTSL